jgi:O-antigen/teichoic acid export membrane protein
MTGRPRVTLINSIAAVILYIALGWLLVPRYGAIAMAGVDAGITALINLTVVLEGRILVGVHPFGRSFLKPLSATAAFAVFLLLWRTVVGRGLALEGVGLILGVVIYVAVLWRFGMDPEERYVFGRIRQKIPFLSRGRGNAEP